jgi:hypothetical protein
MLLVLGKVLPLASDGGLVLPKLERAYAVFNQKERTKEQHLRKPYSCVDAIELLVKECTGTSTAMQGQARTDCLRNIRTNKMELYEWSVSFEKPFRALKLAGYQLLEGDEKELYKDVFAGQITQDELNILFARKFETIDSGVFDRTELETFCNEHREIFSSRQARKRIGPNHKIIL